MKKIIAVLIAIMILFTGCKENKKEIVAEKLIKVEDVKIEKMDDIFETSGNVKPAKTVKVAFKVPGVIRMINGNEGEFLKLGDSLMALDDHQYKLNVASADAQYSALRLKSDSEVPSLVNQAHSQLELMKKRYQRVKTLYENDAIPRDKLDEIEAAVEVIQNKYNEALNARDIYNAQLESVSSMRELAQSQLNDANVSSPINGVILKKLSEVGETIGSGYPVLVMGQIDQVDVEIGVVDSDLKSLKQGQKAQIKIYGIDKTYEGSITEIGTLADSKTRTFPIKIRLENSNLKLKPGMVAKVNIKRSTNQGIMIPLDCINKDAGSEKVFILDEKKNKAYERKIKVGKILGQKIEILEGLKEGEKIVVQGQFRLSDGDKVKLEVARND